MSPVLRIAILLITLAHYVSSQTTSALDVLGCRPSVTVVLDCSSSRLKSVPKWLNRSLLSIELSENEIQVINRTDLAGLSSLTSLSFHSNLIYFIEEGAFSDLRQLNSLRLDENRLTFLTTEHFIGLSNLQSLTLNDNEAMTIDSCLFSQLSSLKHIQLHNTKVDLGNAIITASNECFLRYQNVFLNSSTTFLYVSNLTSLSIGYVGTSSNASYLQNFQSLVRFTISDFPPPAFQNTDLSSLHHLESVAFGGLLEFPQDFLRSESVVGLQITQSRFLCLQRNAFENLPSLQRLILIRNSLNMIDGGAFNSASSLTFINLSFNKLVSLPRRLFDQTGTNLSMSTIRLEGNRWHCDCGLKWLQKIRTKEDLAVVCSTPIDKAGIPLHDVILQCESGSDLNQSVIDTCPSILNIIQSSTAGIPLTSTASPSQEHLLIIVLSVGVGILIFGFVIICLGYWQKTRKVNQLESGIILRDAIDLQQIRHDYFENRSSTTTTRTDLDHSTYDGPIHRRNNSTNRHYLDTQNGSIETRDGVSIATYLEIE